MFLKTCPFCGHMPILEFSGYRGDDHWKGAIVVKCSCGVTAYGGYYYGRPIDYPLEETVGAEKAAIIWNRRTGGES